ncbi:MAG TPA: carbohydrate kinase [Trebonia sp.]|jgi:fructokinase|nr:carbohydrate kinase [Trebonia sp.]
MIAVIGEALIDLVVSASGGDVAARPGGGPYNTARTIARLGAPAVFAGRLSADGFGRRLRSGLEADGVTLGMAEPSGLPTTLAVADVDETGGARYGFYLAGTAAADVDDETLRAAADGARIVHVGTLGLVMEPIASSVERLVAAALPPDVLVMADPNCRPGAIPDRDGYLRRMSRIFGRADVVKASVEDLAYLSPGLSPEQAAAAVLAEGPALVLVTDGPRPARAFAPDEAEISVPAPAVDVVDTIGAGDAFGGAFLANWLAAGLGRDELRAGTPGRTAAIREALAFAAEVAALTCARPGADPPYRADVLRPTAGLRL